MVAKVAGGYISSFPDLAFCCRKMETVIVTAALKKNDPMVLYNNVTKARL